MNQVARGKAGMGRGAVAGGGGARRSIGQLDLMRSDARGISWPPLIGARKATLAALVQWLDRSQWFDPAEMEVRQYRQLALLAGHLQRHSVRFAQRLADAGLEPADLARPEGLRSLPPLGRRDVQAKDPPIFCDSVPEGHAPVHEGRTSGSTGEPVVVRKTAVNRLHWMGMTLRYHLWAEPDFAHPICAIRASMPRYGPTAGWGAPVSLFFDTGPGLMIDVEEDVGRQVELIAGFAPGSLIVYPSNLVALIEQMDARGIDLPSLRRVRTIGETLSQEVRDRAEARIGATVIDCYSSEEVGYIAMQCPDSQFYHLMGETLIVEVVDEEGRSCVDGEVGRLLVTDLHNHATPMIRYAIGDWAEAGPPCPCGRGLPTIRRILGRERNMIVKPDGTRHWPLTGFKQFRDIAPIAQYQMRQHAPDRIELRMVVERPLTVGEEGRLRQHLQSVLGQPFTIEFAYFDGRLPTGRNGKLEEFLRLF